MSFKPNLYADDSKHSQIKLNFAHRLVLDKFMQTGYRMNFSNFRRIFNSLNNTSIAVNVMFV